MGEATYKSYLDFLISNFYYQEYKHILDMNESHYNKNQMLTQLLIDNGYIDLLL